MSAPESKSETQHMLKMSRDVQCKKTIEQFETSLTRNRENKKTSKHRFLSIVFRDRQKVSFCLTHHGISGQLDDWIGVQPIMSLVVRNCVSVSFTRHVLLAASILSPVIFFTWTSSAELWCDTVFDATERTEKSYASMAKLS